LDPVSNFYYGEIVLISYSILGGWLGHNCIFHIYKGHSNVDVSFLYDIITPSSVIFCGDKMLTYFILDLLDRYVVIFWHFIVVTCYELFCINFQCCDLIYVVQVGDCWNNYFVDIHKLICPN